MRIGIFLALAALLLCAPATAAAAPAPAPSSDNAYWLVGAWLCQSRANSSATNTFTRNGDGSIALKTRYVAVAGRRYLEQIKSEAPLHFGLDVTIPQMEFDFVDYHFPATVPDLTFEHLL